MDEKLVQEFKQEIQQRLKDPKVAEAMLEIIQKAGELKDDPEAFGKWFRQYLLNNNKWSDTAKDSILYLSRLTLGPESLLRNLEVEKIFLASDIEHGRIKIDTVPQEYVESFARKFLHQGDVLNRIDVPKEKSLRDNGCLLLDLDYGNKLLVAPIIKSGILSGYSIIPIKSSDNYEVFDNLLVVTRNGSLGCAKVDNPLKYNDKTLELEKFGDSFCLVGVGKNGAISVDFYGKESSVEDIHFIGAPYKTYADGSIYLCSALCKIDKIPELQQKLFDDPKWFLELPTRLFEKEYKTGLKKCLAIVRSGLKEKAKACTTETEREEVQGDVVKVMTRCKEAKVQARKDVKERREAAREQKAASRKMNKSIDRIR